LECTSCDNRSLLAYQSIDFRVNRCGKSLPVAGPVTTLMAIGAQGYSIGDVIRTLPGEVLGAMCFKKWQITRHKKAPSESGLLDIAWRGNQSQLNAPPV
jgi:hypothetical protein